MSIEVTDEMTVAARDASTALTGHCPTYLETKAMLEAVFLLVERDYRVDALCSERLTSDLRCTLAQGHDGNHFTWTPYQPLVGPQRRVTWSD